MKYTIDLSLKFTKSTISSEAKERILEELLNENRVKYEKFYSASNNRDVHSVTGKYIDKKYKITMYDIECSESLYDFIQFMLNKRLKQIDQLNNSWS